MLASKAYDDIDDLPEDFEPDRLLPLDPPRTVLMCSPEHYRIDYVINPHMAADDGRPREVDGEAARQQWETLRRLYESMGYPVAVIEGHPDLPDMVFAANQGLPFPARDTSRGVVLSRMRHAERREEVPRFAKWFTAQGIRLVGPPGGARCYFEGMGDAIWLPGRRLILCGYGFRSNREGVGVVAGQSESPLFALELLDPDLYHLDMVLAPLTEKTALIWKKGIGRDGLELLDEIFDTYIEPPEEEVRGGFACNAHCLDGRTVIIDEACRETIRLLGDAGFDVKAIDTSEFRKAGGSVFCLKNMVF